MSDVVTGLRRVIQHLVAPELKSHAAKLEMRSEFLLLKTNPQMEVMRQVSPISERIAIVESRTKRG